MIRKHTVTSYTLEHAGHSFPIPFEVHDPEFFHLSDDGLTTWAGCLAHDDSPGDPFVEFDEGTFVQFDRNCNHYEPRPSAESMLAIIRDNPGRVFYVGERGEGYTLKSYSPLRFRDALTVDDADGYYIAPEDATDPAGYARGALETYSAYCEGEVYGTIVWRFTRESADSDEWTLDEDSRDSECWSFYGYKYALGELKATFEHEVKGV